MTETALGRVWAWLHKTFPERQIYIRSDGRVQFFTFGASLQATLAGLVFIFLGWVAFATVNVIFKDRIIAAKDHRYQQMQSAYENRVSDLQVSYDELNGALVAAEDRFKATADAVENKQNAIAVFINHESAEQTAASKALMAAPVPVAPRLNFTPAPKRPVAHSEAPVSETPAMDSTLGESGQPVDQGMAASGRPLPQFVLPGPAVPPLLTPKPEKSSMLERAWNKVASLLEPLPNEPLPGAAVYAQHPGLRILARETQRLARDDQTQNVLIARTEGNLEQGVGNLRNLIRRAGINPDQFAGHLNQGMGGPEIPLDHVKIQGISDPGFTKTYLGAVAMLGQLGTLSGAVDRIPLSVPVAEESFDRTSGFGPRIDPFTGRIAFHPGVDFAGPWGSAVHATAPGTVVFAGNKGGYGTMVEIDHGNGIHTRYGHLSALTVRAGMKVGRGTAIGRVGSTGRSTGPHVHYEVWYDDVVRNPSNFIEAGRHVL
jgi:murein DD-endopeptidase MepM/ murein hydrolase activator NlpD